MLVLSLLKGLVVGLVVALPVGPAGVFCLDRSILRGPRVGICCGVGMALADTVFAGIAILGLAEVQGFLASHHALLRAITGLALALLGLSMLRARAIPTQRRLPGVFGNVGTTFALTIANPATILVICGLLTALGLGQGCTSVATALPILMGIAIGSLAWAFGIAAVGQSIGHRCGHSLPKLRQLAGAALVIGGAITFTLGWS